MNTALAKYAYGLVIVAVLIFALIYFRALLQPFVLALLVWYLIRSTKLTIGKIRIGRFQIPTRLHAFLAILLTFSVFWGIYKIISINVNLIVEAAPGYEDNFDQLLDSLMVLVGIEDVNNLLQRIRELDFRNIFVNTVNSISLIVGNAALVLFYVIFLLIEETFFPIKVQNMVRQSDELRASRRTEIFQQVGRSINTYFAVKTAVSVLTGVLSYIILLIIGVDFAVLWAFLIFIFNFIPYVGSLLATLLPAFFAVFQFGQFLPALWIFLGIQVVQIFVGSVVEPKIMGQTLNLSPLVVVVALSFWGSIWGIVGMILAVPIVSVAVIIMAHFPESRNLAILLSEKGSLT